MKNTLIILINITVGILSGTSLGFFIPYGIAQINPADGPALAFIPIISVPGGAILGGVIGLVVGIYKVRRENFIREMFSPTVEKEAEKG